MEISEIVCDGSQVRQIGIGIVQIHFMQRCLKYKQAFSNFCENLKKH